MKINFQKGKTKMVSSETWSFALKTKKKPVSYPWNDFSETLVMARKTLIYKVVDQ